MNDSRRLLRGISANLVAVGTRIAVQFATLPIFFASWTVEAVGSWLILFAVPAYLALVGNGFAGAGGTAALGAASDGDMPRARRDFRAAWMISTVSTALLAVAFAGASVFILPALAGQGGTLDLSDMGQAAAWLALYIFATSQMALFDIPYRVAGRYPDHIFLYNAASLCEIAVIALAVSLSDSFADLAMALALFRCLSAIVIFRGSRRAAPQLFEAGHGPIRPSLAQLWRPSLAFMLMPIVFGLNLQGYLLLVGAAFGAAMLAAFAATRTLTRLLDLVTNVTFGLQFYESGYIKGDRRAIQRRMLATTTLVSLAIATFFTLGLLAIGPWLQDLYTLGKTQFDMGVALILMAAATLRNLSAAPVAVLAADNDHARMVVGYLAMSALALLLAVALGTSGAPLLLVLAPLVLAEASQFFPSMRRALVALEWSGGEFIAALASRERFADLSLLLRKLARRS